MVIVKERLIKKFEHKIFCSICNKEVYSYDKFEYCKNKNKDNFVHFNCLKLRGDKNE